MTRRCAVIAGDEISSFIVGKLEQSARLIGRADVDRIVAACLAKMGEVSFSDAYDEGRKMSLEEAVACALKEV